MENIYLDDPYTDAIYHEGRAKRLRELKQSRTFLFSISAVLVLMAVAIASTLVIAPYSPAREDMIIASVATTAAAAMAAWKGRMFHRHWKAQRTGKTG